VLAAEVRRQPRRSSSPRSFSLSRRFMFAVEVHEASAGRRGSGLAADSCGRPRSFSSPPTITKLRLAGEVPGLPQIVADGREGSVRRR